MTRIKQLREEKKLSQKRLAEQLKVAQNTISSWEHGKREPDTETIKALTEIFDVTADYLLGLSDEKKSPASVPSSESAQMLLELCGNLTPEYQDELLRYGQYLLTQQRSQSDS